MALLQEETRVPEEELEAFFSHVTEGNYNQTTGYYRNRIPVHRDDALTTSAVLPTPRDSLSFY
jgi:hypothetical protein